MTIPIGLACPQRMVFSSGGMVFVLVGSPSLVWLCVWCLHVIFSSVETTKWWNIPVADLAVGIHNATLISIHSVVFGLLNKFMRGVRSPSSSFAFFSRHAFYASDRHHCGLMVGPVTSPMYSGHEQWRLQKAYASWR
jgi:hypothetical protein